MRHLIAAALAALPQVALACDTAVCVISADELTLPRIITFDDTRKTYGPGHPVDGILVLDGAQFAERFAGQQAEPDGPHDRITGTALGPLTLMPGPRGQNLSVAVFTGISVLNGYGPAGFPKRDAQGEGAISVLFQEDQYALTLTLRGGETGTALISFLRRDGNELARLRIGPLAETAIGFIRRGGRDDIAGLVITNDDPQGIAIDTITFGKPPDLS